MRNDGLLCAGRTAAAQRSMELSYIVRSTIALFDEDDPNGPAAMAPFAHASCLCGLHLPGALSLFSCLSAVGRRRILLICRVAVPKHTSEPVRLLNWSPCRLFPVILRRSPRSSVFISARSGQRRTSERVTLDSRCGARLDQCSWSSQAMRRPPRRALWLVAACDLAPAWSHWDRDTATWIHSFRGNREAETAACRRRASWRIGGIRPTRFMGA